MTVPVYFVRSSHHMSSLLFEHRYVTLIFQVSTFHKESSYKRIAQDEQREIKHYSLVELTQIV